MAEDLPFKRLPKSLLDYYEANKPQRIKQQAIIHRQYKMFYNMAKWAIDQGLLTPAERDLISRVGTRKYPYFGRHLRTLKEVILERIKEREDERKRAATT